MRRDDIVMIAFFGLMFSILLLVLAGAAVSVWWKSRQESRRAEREAELKKHMLDRGLSVEEIERLIRVTAEQPKQSAKIDDEDVDALGELGGLLGGCEDAKPDAIEEIFAFARTAEPKMRRAMVSAVTEWQGVSGKITGEQIRAIVRALAHPVEPSLQAKIPVEDLPPFPSTSSRITESFHIPE